MVPTRPTSAFLRKLTPLLVVLLISGSLCVVNAVQPGDLYCDFIARAKEVDGKCVCENLDDIFDDSYLKCVPVAYDGILSECEETIQCSERLGQGAGCKNGECVCVENFHYMHGTCWPTRNYGESCKADTDCLAYAESDAYACVDGACACAEGASPMRPGSSSPLCRRNAREGEECESNLECSGNFECIKLDSDDLNYVCSTPQKNAGISQRIANFSSNRLLSSEVPKANVSSLRVKSQRPKQVFLAPEADEECGTNEELTPVGKTCVCKRGFFKPTAESSCLPELGEPCWVDETDSKNPHILYGACRRSAKYSEDSSTPDGVWACLGGFVADPQNRICEKTRKVTFNCRIDSQCAYYGGFCSDGKCQCEDGQTYDSDKLVCLEAKGLNEECTSDEDCGVATEGSVECRGGTCQCKESYHPLGNDCRKDANAIGDQCTETSDCVFASADSPIICDAGVCYCDAGYFPLDEVSCQVGINGKCRSNTDCSAVQFAECVGGSCVCADGYVRSGTSACLKVATDYEEECEETDQCTGLTTDGEYISCSTETFTCVCNPDYHYYNSRCWNMRSLNQRCAYQSECIAENSLCKNNFCTCDFGYIADGNTCIAAAPHALTASFATIVFIIIASRLL